MVLQQKLGDPAGSRGRRRAIATVEGSIDEEELEGGHCGTSSGGTKNRREKIFAHLRICKCNAATKSHRYEKKHKRHRLTRPVPECSFVNRIGVKKSRPKAVIHFVGKQIRKYTKEPLGTFYFGWCLLYSQAMPRDFVPPTNTQIDKYK